jgi:hypothetical protein
MIRNTNENDARPIINDNIVRETNLEKRYSLIIDYVCNYLDNKMKTHNYCDFQDGKCIANRLKKTTRETNGCCYHYQTGLCKHLKEGTCTIKNVSCKLYMCHYLETKVIKFKLEDILPIKSLLNKKQITILEKSYFKPKEEVIKLLLSAN